ncbi:hypothetical protein PRUB_a2467 [Pseudoalteromonas rubra]|uniref:Uncharacterized protein n=1 Tax=Pseudoalteromonas rubra TaxID=43658 RepID=A0A0L0EVA7_9GAMM|nr:MULTISPECIES: hypothetical protein [Pseudoalteromonas]KAF7787937.1 hypothetical protein PRUB_a2467 [Pseudoalteromonas rubra]KNC68402.1 hypothetical protein AC626_04965 [Pseudoalteromonas rubra]MDK1313402.1 hypothetical protein [Pseudoalteromonas sp. R96]MEC4087826.1 hypothetical protein [Pseudoalteromonas rubra]
MSQTVHNLGAYGAVVLAKDFSKDFINAFEHINQRDGVKITPLAGQSQLVNGTNYAFYCLVEPVVAPDVAKVNKLEVIVIHALDDKYTETAERVLSRPVLVPPIGSFDGVALRDDFTEAEQAAAEQIESLVGVHYDILAAQQQVVAGLNFVFYSVVKPATRNGQAFFAEIEAHRNLEGRLENFNLIPVKP